MLSPSLPPTLFYYVPSCSCGERGGSGGPRLTPSRTPPRSLLAPSLGGSTFSSCLWIDKLLFRSFILWYNIHLLLIYIVMLYCVVLYYIHTVELWWCLVGRLKDTVSILLLFFPFLSLSPDTLPLPFPLPFPFPFTRFAYLCATAVPVNADVRVHCHRGGLQIISYARRQRGQWGRERRGRGREGDREREKGERGDGRVSRGEGRGVRMKGYSFTLLEFRAWTSIVIGILLKLMLTLVVPWLDPCQ